MTLDMLEKGETGLITAITHDNDGHWRKLASFGLLPGARVTMKQRWPAYVVQVGFTEVGLDRATAALIAVEKVISL